MNIRNKKQNKEERLNNLQSECRFWSEYIFRVEDKLKSLATPDGDNEGIVINRRTGQVFQGNNAPDIAGLRKMLAFGRSQLFKALINWKLGWRIFNPYRFQ